MTACTTVNIKTSNPEPLVEQYCDQLLSSEPESLLLLVHYPFEQYWLDEKPVIALSALYCLSKVSSGARISFLVVAAVDWSAELEVMRLSPAEALQHVSHQLGVPVVVSNLFRPCPPSENMTRHSGANGVGNSIFTRSFQTTHFSISVGCSLSHSKLPLSGHCFGISPAETILRPLHSSQRNIILGNGLCLFLH